MPSKKDHRDAKKQKKRPKKSYILFSFSPMFAMLILPYYDMFGRLQVDVDHDTFSIIVFLFGLLAEIIGKRNRLLKIQWFRRYVIFVTSYTISKEHVKQLFWLSMWMVQIGQKRNGILNLGCHTCSNAILYTHHSLLLFGNPMLFGGRKSSLMALTISRSRHIRSNCSAIL